MTEYQNQTKSENASRVRISPLSVVGVTFALSAILTASALAGLPVGMGLILCLNFVALIVAFHRNGRSIVAPSIVFGLILTGFGLLGYFVYPAIQAYGRTPGHDPTYLIVGDEAVRLATLGWFTLSSLVLLIGSWVTGVRVTARRSDQFVNVLERIAKSNVPIYFSVFSIAFNLLVRDFGELIDRDTYHIETEIGGVATYLQLPAAFMLGMILRRRNVFTRVSVLSLMAVIVGFSFALSSRMLSLAVLMFFAGIAVSARRLKWVPIVMGVAAALILMPVPIFMRGLPEQGLVPNFEALPRVPLFSEESYWSTAGNLLSAFSVVALTGSSPTIPWETMALSILPLPGSVFGGSASVSQLRINFAIPYAGLGEIANQGLIFLLLFFLVLGLILGWVERRTEALRGFTGPTAETLVPVAVAALTAFLFVQYNLRTSMRLEYVLILCGIYFSVRIAVIRRRSAGTLAKASVIQNHSHE